MHIEFLVATFSAGLAIPARLRLVRDDGSAVDIRTDARRNSRSLFWEYFRDCAFSLAEMETAIHRHAPSKMRVLIEMLAPLRPKIPRNVNGAFSKLFEDFPHVRMGICYDPECGAAGVTHGHAYQMGAVLPEACFHTRSHARAWLDRDPPLDAMALRRQIDGWPLPDSAPVAVICSMTAANQVA